jgi:sugar (pentulose or hexulose) kinase
MLRRSRINLALSVSYRLTGQRVTSIAMALTTLTNPHHESGNDDDIAAAQALIEALLSRASGIK